MALQTHYPLWMQTAPTSGGEPLPAEQTAALLAALQARLGTSVQFGGAPVLADASYGPGAVQFTLDGPDLAAGWRQPLVARSAGAAAEAAFAAAAEANTSLPCTGPSLVEPSLAVSQDLGDTMVVSAVPAGRDVMDLINAEPGGAGDRLRELGRLHAALNGVSPEAVPGLPAFDFDQSLAGLPSDLASAREWLVANRPPALPAVVCHGGLTPLEVRVVDGDPRPSIRNWSAAVAAEAEYDLAWTMLSFWIAPLFAVTRSERRGMTMIRDGLANLYRTAYAEVRPVDERRLDYWQAFHCIRGILDAAARPAALPEDLASNLRKRYIRLSRRR